MTQPVYWQGGGKARLRKWLFTFLSKILLSQKRIIQWDSWRFWECLLSKSVAIHVDLEKYGVTLPIMPKNWEHYVGIDFDNLKNCLDKFISLGESGLREIAESGNSWAHKNYSPSVSAKRVLRQVGLLV